MSLVLDKFPENSILVANVDDNIYNKSVRDGLEMYSIKPPFEVCVYFFPSDIYLVDYEYKTPTDCCSISNGIIKFEFKYLLRQLLIQDPRALSLLFFDESAYIYKDFYGRAILDYNYLFQPENFDLVAANKMFKDILYDYVLSNRTDR